MTRIYIDLTTSIRWRRPPVGIVRVEREFARHCLAHEPDTVFCEIDAAGGYRAMAEERVRAVLDEGWCRAEAVVAVSAQPAAAPQMPVRGRIQRMFDWLAAKGPRMVPAAAYPLLRDLGRVLVDHHAAYVRHRETRRAARAVEAVPPTIAAAARTASTTAAGEALIQPQPQDLFFSIGLQWHHGAIHAWHLKQRTGVRVVEACYDTIPIDFPEYAGSAKQPFADHFSCIAHTADMVFAISDTSRADLQRFYQRVGLLHSPSIRTVHLATPDVVSDTAVQALADDERAALLQLGRDYVLYVSTFETRKNHRLLLQVWKELHRRRGDACPMLVVVGMFGWGVNDLWAEMQASDVWSAGRIVMLHHVSDALLAHLYRDCAFTVFPSFYEGWGLAATESLAYGKLAIVSDTPALREATQGLCPAIHPLDWPRWFETITHYIDDPSARAAAEQRIRATYVPRTWRDFAAELLAAARDR
jgi:glycosyltransferase involved in cell wall biosynthesis